LQIEEMMDLRCPHCGETIVARSFCKCPGCQQELPDELKLNAKELEFDKMEEDWKRKEKLYRGDVLDQGGGAGGPPSI